MPTRVFIHGAPPLRPNGRASSTGKWDLEAALEAFLGSAGEVVTDDHCGPGLGIDLLLYTEADPEWADRLVPLLRGWGVPAEPRSRS